MRLLGVARLINAVSLSHGLVTWDSRYTLKHTPSSVLIETLVVSGLTVTHEKNDVVRPGTTKKQSADLINIGAIFFLTYDFLKSATPGISGEPRYDHSATRQYGYVPNFRRKRLIQLLRSGVHRDLNESDMRSNYHALGPSTEKDL